MIVLSETFVYLYDVAYLDMHSIYKIAYHTISGYHMAFSDLMSNVAYDRQL